MHSFLCDSILISMRGGFFLLIPPPSFHPLSTRQPIPTPSAIHTTFLRTAGAPLFVAHSDAFCLICICVCIALVTRLVDAALAHPILTGSPQAQPHRNTAHNAAKDRAPPARPQATKNGSPRCCKAPCDVRLCAAARSARDAGGEERRGRGTWRTRGRDRGEDSDDGGSPAHAVRGLGGGERVRGTERGPAACQRGQARVTRNGKSMGKWRNASYNDTEHRMERSRRLQMALWIRRRAMLARHLPKTVRAVFIGKGSGPPAWC